MSAIAMKSEYKYDLDIMKVIYMLAIHELGEAVIGDLTQFQIDAKEKENIEHEVVHNILKESSIFSEEKSAWFLKEKIWFVLYFSFLIRYLQDEIR